MPRPPMDPEVLWRNPLNCLERRRPELKGRLEPLDAAVAGLSIAAGAAA